MALLTCVGLTRSPWFKDRDLHLNAGEIVVLSGPTGAGKTLFLRSLADLDPVESGRLSLAGEDRETLRPAVWRSRVLYLHQSGVTLTATVRDTVCRVLGLAVLERAAAARFTLPAGLDEDAEAARLSGGERQLLALALAFACAPRVLLLDESTSALDEPRARMWETNVRRWVDAGHAALWVTHDATLAGRIGARVESFGGTS